MYPIRLLPFLMIALLAAGCASVDTVEAPVIATRAEAAAPVEPVIMPDPVPAAHSVLAPRDTWSELRGGFQLDIPDNKRVRQSIKKYSRSPRDVTDIFIRGKPYISYILDEVNSRGFPTEIALLPFVESGFDPFAYSHGRAAGLWQFIPGTAKMYGLTLDWWHDERRDVVASTRAAMDYLDKLQQQFDGDWLLALAAYNSGSGTVRSAMRRNRKAGKPVDFWNLRLPKETRAYVPRLLAISAIVEEPGRYNITLPDQPRTPGFAQVDTGGQLDIAVAAELAGISPEALYRLNPGINRWATHPDGPHRLLVPAASADRFSENLAGLPDENRTRWVRHRIGKGQTLSHVASKYDTTVAVLQQSNRLKGTNIRAGEHLMVPVAARDATQYTAPARLAASKGRGSKTTYRVRNGDSLWVIARKHSVSVRQLARWNGMSSGDLIRPGQKLVIWMNAPTGAGNERLRSVRYTVRSGDSLYLISKKFNVSISELRRWNKLGKEKYIQPGQKLTLYVDVTRLTRG